MRCFLLSYIILYGTYYPTLNSGQQFDVDSAILKSLVGLKIDLAVSPDLHLDSYGTSLSFFQKNVSAVVRFSI